MGVQFDDGWYCGWLRNPASPTGWLKPKQNNGMFTTYQLVQDFATIHRMKAICPSRCLANIWTWTAWYHRRHRLPWLPSHGQEKHLRSWPCLQFEKRHVHACSPQVIHFFQAISNNNRCLARCEFYAKMIRIPQAEISCLGIATPLNQENFTQMWSWLEVEAHFEAAHHWNFLWHLWLNRPTRQAEILGHVWEDFQL